MSVSESGAVASHAATALILTPPVLLSDEIVTPNVAAECASYFFLIVWRSLRNDLFDSRAHGK